MKACHDEPTECNHITLEAVDHTGRAAHRRGIADISSRDVGDAAREIDCELPSAIDQRIRTADGSQALMSNLVRTVVIISSIICF